MKLMNEFVVVQNWVVGLHKANNTAPDGSKHKSCIDFLAFLNHNTVFKSINLRKFSLWLRRNSNSLSSPTRHNFNWLFVSSINADFFVLKFLITDFNSNIFASFSVCFPSDIFLSYTSIFFLCIKYRTDSLFIIRNTVTYVDGLFTHQVVTASAML